MSGTRFIAAFAALVLAAASPTLSYAGTSYEYDSAGRLIKVTYSNGVSIEYRYDASGNRQVVTTTQAPNAAPVAVADSASVAANNAVDISVLANDSDPDQDPLTITAVSTPTGGTATILSGPARIRYTAPGSGGTYTFNYTISDGRGHTANATVTVTVSAPPPPVNSAPVAVGDDAYTSPKSSIAIMVRANDSDPDGDPLTVTSVTTPTGGTAAVAGGGNYVIYTAPFGNGQFTFNYTISDGRGGTASASVIVYVERLEN